jgi:hypothetical protein
MKRSEAIKKLTSKVISPFEIISYELQDIYYMRAERLLTFIEKELHMTPPEYWEGDGFHGGPVKEWEKE